MANLGELHGRPDDTALACVLHRNATMPSPSALDLMIAQHDEIDALLSQVARATSADERAAALDTLADKLTLHLAVEQELLYPAADPLITDEVRAELMTEHNEIKRVLADLIWLEHEDQRFARKLIGLQNLLAWHEAWQEDVLFDRLSRALPETHLTSLTREVSVWFDRTQSAFATAA